jgi:hypothetical protein
MNAGLMEVGGFLDSWFSRCSIDSISNKGERRGMVWEECRSRQ